MVAIANTNNDTRQTARIIQWLGGERAGEGLIGRNDIHSYLI
jgi:hypothetical protein